MVRRGNRTALTIFRAASGNQSGEMSGEAELFNAASLKSGRGYAGQSRA
jgi:hypothetical protein